MIRAKSFSKTLYNNNDKLYSTCTPISTSHHLPRNFQKFSRFKESDIGARDKNHKPNSIQYSSIHILPYLTTRKNLSSLSSIVEHRQRREISFFSGYFSPLFQKKKISTLEPRQIPSNMILVRRNSLILFFPYVLAKLQR